MTMPPNNRPLILVFSAFYDPWMSGAERFVKEVVERLSSRYHFVIFTARLSRRVPARESRRGFEIVRLGVGHQLDKWFYLLLAPVASIFYRPTLIHAVMESYAGVALLLAKVFHPRLPRLLTLQSGDLDEKAARGKIPCWLWRLVHSAPTAVTAISGFLADRARDLGVPERRLRVIPNGVDLKRYLPREEKEVVSSRLICVARLSREKGLADLIKAFALIHAQNRQARLVLVGDGPERERLEEMVRKSGLAAAVSFRGALPHDEALKEMRAAEIFVCPSLAEGLGIVFLEAQAQGIPVIGTRVGGIPDVIQDEQTGLLTPPNNPEALAAAIDRLMRDSVLQKLLSRQALERVKRFDWEIIVRELADFYEEIMADSKF